MFELDFDQLKEQGMQFADTAKKTTMDWVDKGKNQLDLINQQMRLSKAERQLGALVYSLHKSGEQNQPLLDKYIEAVDEVEKAIDEIKSKMTPAERAAAEKAETAESATEIPIEDDFSEEAEAPSKPTKTCPVCGAKVDADALFCNRCGAQL